MVPLVACAPTIPSLPSTVIKQMEEMFLRLGFSHAVVLKLVDDQRTLASLSDEDIAAICNMIHGPGGLVNGTTPERGNLISVLVAENFKLVVFILRQWSIVPRTTGIRTSTAHLCCTTNINESKSR